MQKLKSMKQLRFNLKTKILFSVVVIVSTVIFFYGALIIGIARKNLISNIETYGTSLAKSVAQSTATAMAVADYELLKSEANDILTSMEEITQVKFLDRSNKVIAESKKIKGINEEEVITVTAPVLLDGERIGVVSIGLSIIPTKKAITKLILITTLMLILTILILITMIVLNINKMVILPIKKMTSLTNKVSEGNLDYQIDIKSKDELEDLATSFNKMTKELKRNRDELEKAKMKLEERIAERTKELEETNVRLVDTARHKSVFLASMSHELRTPLNSIIGFTGIILGGLSGDISEEQRKQLSMVKKSADHLLSLINDLLDISKVEAGKMNIFIEKFELRDLMQEVCDSFIPAADKKGIKILLDMPESLIIENDKRRIKQIIVNIVGNAVKFSLGKEIEIRVRKRDELIIVAIRDTGPGIKKEDIPDLFEPFTQLKYTITKEKGTGLGLYLTKHLIKNLGGNIRVESEFGKGSVFIFTFPVKYVEGEDEKEDDFNS